MRYVAQATQDTPKAEVSWPFQSADDKQALLDANSKALRLRLVDVRVWCVEKGRPRRVR